VKLSIKTYFRRFFANRMPKGESLTLNPRSTYILPTKVGYMLLMVVILMLIGATNYQNNLAFLLTFLLIGLGLVTSVFTVRNLQGIEFALNKPAEVFAGQSLPIAVSLKSINQQNHYSVGVGLNKKALMLTDVALHEFSRVSITIQAQHRGWLNIPKLVASSQFPFGWLSAWGYFAFEKSVLVYPRPLEPAQIDLQASGQETDEGRKFDGNEDLYGLRSYQQGEPLSRVDWKAFARERGLYVREFAQYQSAQHCFSWHDFPGIEDELRLSYLTYLVLDAASQNLHYALELPSVSFDLADGELHRARCLKALALYGIQSGGAGDSL
jgi:uncharacterized protein (DUF58 family)